MTQYNDDPLDFEKAPSLSFNQMPVGTTYTGRVMGPASLVQSRDFESGEPATWPDGNPKMAVVIRLEVNGETRSLWAAKPSAMFVALVEAQKASGQRIGEGGILHVRFSGETPNAKNPRLNPAKQYQCKYEPPAHDPFADESPAQPPRSAAASTAPSMPKAGW